jgi:hypothetical protein
MTAARYRITVRGRLSERFASAFEGMTLERKPRETTLVGMIADQGHLYGILDRLRDFGLELVCLEEVGPESPRAPSKALGRLEDQPAPR